MVGLLVPATTCKTASPKRYLVVQEPHALVNMTVVASVSPTCTTYAQMALHAQVATIAETTAKKVQSSATLAAEKVQNHVQQAPTSVDTTAHSNYNHFATNLSMPVPPMKGARVPLLPIVPSPIQRTPFAVVACLAIWIRTTAHRPRDHVQPTASAPIVTTVVLTVLIPTAERTSTIPAIVAHALLTTNALMENAVVTLPTARVRQ